MLCRVKYTGATPGADSNTYVLFDTTIAFPGAQYLQMSNSKRLVLDIDHAAALTLKWYKPKSTVSGVSGRPRTSTADPTLADWEQIGDSGSLAAPAASATTTYDILVEPYPDFLLTVVNGGSSQAAKFIVDMTLTDERSTAA